MTSLLDLPNFQTPADLPNISIEPDPAELEKAKYLWMMRMGLGMAGREPIGQAMSAGMDAAAQMSNQVRLNHRANMDLVLRQHQAKQQQLDDIRKVEFLRSLSVEELRGKYKMPDELINLIKNSSDPRKTFAESSKPFLDPYTLNTGAARFIPGQDQPTTQMPNAQGMVQAFEGGLPVRALPVPGMQEGMARSEGMTTAAKNMNTPGTWQGGSGQESGYPGDVFRVQPPAFRGGSDFRSMLLGGSPFPGSGAPTQQTMPLQGPQAVPQAVQQTPQAPQAPQAQGRGAQPNLSSIAALQQALNEQMNLKPTNAQQADTIGKNIAALNDAIARIQAGGSAEAPQDQTKSGVLKGQNPIDVTRASQGGAAILEMSKPMFEDQRKLTTSAIALAKHVSNMAKLDAGGVYTGPAGFLWEKFSNAWNSVMPTDDLKLDPERLANTQTFTTEISKMQQALGKAFPGQQSNYELQVVTNALPQLMLSKEGRAKIYSMIRIAAKYEQDNLANMSAHAKANNGDLLGWNPLPLPESPKEIGQAQPVANTPQEGTTVTTPDGKMLRFPNQAAANAFKKQYKLP